MTNYKKELSERLEKIRSRWYEFNKNDFKVNGKVIGISDWWLSEIDTLLRRIEKEYVPKKLLKSKNKNYNERVYIYNTLIDQFKSNLNKLKREL